MYWNVCWKSNPGKWGAATCSDSDSRLYSRIVKWKWKMVSCWSDYRGTSYRLARRSPTARCSGWFQFWERRSLSRICENMHQKESNLFWCSFKIEEWILNTVNGAVRKPLDWSIFSFPFTKTHFTKTDSRVWGCDLSLSSRMSQILTCGWWCWWQTQRIRPPPAPTSVWCRRRPQTGWCCKSRGRASCLWSDSGCGRRSCPLWISWPAGREKCVLNSQIYILQEQYDSI